MSLFGLKQQAKAQVPRPLPLQQILTQAVQNNRGIQGAQYQVESQKALQSGTTDIGKTSLNFTYGQYNSYYNDNSLTIAQTIPFPGTFARQGKVYETAIVSAEMQKKVLESELALQIKSTYNLLLLEKSRSGLLRRQNRLFESFLRSAEIRFKTGEANLIEKITAESQLYELRNRQNQNEADIRILENRLQVYLYAPEAVTTAEDTLKKLPFVPTSDSASVTQNPLLRYFASQVKQTEASTKLEKTRLWPDFTVGYFNQTLYGTPNYQKPEIVAGSTSRFQGVSFGLAIPIWAKPQLAKIRYAEAQKNASSAQLDVNRKNLEGQYAQAIQEYQKWKSSLAYFETTALPTARTLNESALKSYKSGNIGYVEFLQGMNRAVQLETEYLQLLNQYNQSILQIEFLTGKIQ